MNGSHAEEAAANDDLGDELHKALYGNGTDRVALFDRLLRRRRMAKLNRPPVGMTQAQSDALAEAMYRRYRFTAPPPTDANGEVDSEVYARWLLEDNAAALARLRADRPRVADRMEAFARSLRG